MKKLFLIIILISQWCLPAWAESFVVQNIQIEGLQHAPASTVEHYLPIKRGETLEPSETKIILRKLYQTGFFDHITLSRKGNTLIIHVVERPTIGELKISGNSVIPTSTLTDVMKKLDIAEGRVYRPDVLSSIRKSLLNQYYQLGYFNARVDVIQTPMPHHRILLKIDISEGIAARLRRITIIGNHVYDKSVLLRQLDLTTTGVFTFVTQADTFSEEKMEHSLDTLRSYYMDRGYLRCEVKSAQAEITPDRKSVEVVIVIDEGQTYTVDNVVVTGDTRLKEEIKKLIPIKHGDLFSRRTVMSAEKSIVALLGQHGYLFAGIMLHPEINDRDHRVILNFHIQPGKRVYVHHITFSDHHRTNDEVLRREMLQWEASPASMTLLETSKQRLILLPFIRDVEMSIKPTPHAEDQVDVNYKVKEDNSATATFKVGYSQIERVIFGLGFNQKNFLGTGSTFGVNFQHSKYEQYDAIEYSNPYYTPDGISRSIRVSSSRVEPRGAGVNNGYTTNEYDADVLYGIPVGQDDTVMSRSYLGFGYQDSIVYLIPGGVSEQIDHFVTMHGTHFQELDLKMGYSRDSRDKAIFPTSGAEQSLFADAFAPLTSGSVGYYTLNYHAKWYQPLYGPFILLSRANLGYGNGYHGVDDFPFFRNYYAGGIDSVRGFQGYTLGPRDSNGKPFGGNMLIDGSIGLIFPNYISENLRTSAYLDLGNVYTSLHNRKYGGQSIDSGAIRYSVGVETDVLTPFGPIRLSLARVLNYRKRPSDYLEAFQFAMGANF